MNLQEKLIEIRVYLQELNIKKSGYNNFKKFSYFELSDFLPIINRICLEQKIFCYVDFQYCVEEKPLAKLVICDLEKEGTAECFYCPMPRIIDRDKTGATMQDIGAIQTYARRYLYMAAFEIAENDEIDNKDMKTVKQSAPTFKKPIESPQATEKLQAPPPLKNLQATETPDVERINLIGKIGDVMKAKVGNIDCFTEKEKQEVRELIGAAKTNIQLKNVFTRYEKLLLDRKSKAPKELIEDDIF